MARRNSSYQDLFLQSLDGLGRTALGAGQMVGQHNRAEAENTRQQAEETRRGEEHKTRMPWLKAEADSKSLDYDKALRQENITKSMMGGLEAHKADPLYADAQLASLTLGRQVTPEELRTQRSREDKKAGLEVDGKEASVGLTKAQTAESIARASREKDGSKRDRFRELVDEQGNVQRWNVDTNEITPTGVKKKLPGDKPVDVADAVAQAQRGLSAIDQMIGSEDGKTKEHPGFRSAVGAKGASSLFGMREKPIAGSDAADFMSLYDQVTGQAFLEAFSTLKGGGTITEQEGAKAQAAITRMQTSQSEDEFKKAALEFRQVIRDGLARSQRKAGGGQMPPGDAAPPPAAGGLDRNDPKVKAALAAGYTEDEIRAYMGGGR